MDLELVLFYINVIASCISLVCFFFAFWQFAHVEYKVYMCKQKLYNVNKYCKLNQF